MLSLQIVSKSDNLKFIKIDKNNENIIFEDLKNIIIQFFKFRNISLTKENLETILSVLIKTVSCHKYITFDCILKGLKSIPVSENNLSAATIEHFIMQRYKSSEHSDFIKLSEQKEKNSMQAKIPFTESELYQIGIERINSIKEFYKNKGVIMMTFSDELFENLLRKGYFKKYTTDEEISIISQMAINSIKKELNNKLSLSFDKQAKNELELFEFAIKSYYPNHAKITEKYPAYKIELRRSLLKKMFDDEK